MPGRGHIEASTCMLPPTVHPDTTRAHPRHPRYDRRDRAAFSLLVELCGPVLVGRPHATAVPGARELAVQEGRTVNSAASQDRPRATDRVQGARTHEAPECVAASAHACACPARLRRPNAKLSIYLCQLSRVWPDCGARAETGESRETLQRRAVGTAAFHRGLRVHIRQSVGACARVKIRAGPK